MNIQDSVGRIVIHASDNNIWWNSSSVFRSIPRRPSSRSLCACKYLRPDWMNPSDGCNGGTIEKLCGYLTFKRLLVVLIWMSSCAGRHLCKLYTAYTAHSTHTHTHHGPNRDAWHFWRISRHPMTRSMENTLQSARMDVCSCSALCCCRWCCCCFFLVHFLRALDIWHSRPLFQHSHLVLYICNGTANITLVHHHGSLLLLQLYPALGCGNKSLQKKKLEIFSFDRNQPSTRWRFSASYSPNFIYEHNVYCVSRILGRKRHITNVCKIQIAETINTMPPKIRAGEQWTMTMQMK